MADAPAANWTAADVERLSAQGWRVELWKGQLLRMAPTGDVHGRVTWRLSRALDRYVEAHSLGQLWPAEAGFDLTRPDEAQQTVLAPDIAFRACRARAAAGAGLCARRARSGRRDRLAHSVAPGDGRQGAAVAGAWRAGRMGGLAGAPPGRRMGPGRRPAHPGPDDTLDGHEVVPGFRLPLADLFAA
jgi:hypothetical protein